MKLEQEQFDYIEQQYLNLSEKEKEALRQFIRSDVGQIVMKLMGPDFTSVMGMLRAPKRGIAAPR